MLNFFHSLRLACFFKGWSSDGSDGCWRIWRPLELTLLIQFGRNHPSGNWYRCATIISWPGVSKKIGGSLQKILVRWCFFWPPKFRVCQGHLGPQGSCGTRGVISQPQSLGFCLSWISRRRMLLQCWRSLKSGSRLRNGWEFLAGKKGVILCIYVYIYICLTKNSFQKVRSRIRFVLEKFKSWSPHVGCYRAGVWFDVWKNQGIGKNPLCEKISALIIDFVGC